MEDRPCNFSSLLAANGKTFSKKYKKMNDSKKNFFFHQLMDQMRCALTDTGDFDSLRRCTEKFSQILSSERTDEEVLRNWFQECFSSKLIRPIEFNSEEISTDKMCLGSTESDSEIRRCTANTSMSVENVAEGSNPKLIKEGQTNLIDVSTDCEEMSVSCAVNNVETNNDMFKSIYELMCAGDVKEINKFLANNELSNEEMYGLVIEVYSQLKIRKVRLSDAVDHHLQMKIIGERLFNHSHRVRTADLISDENQVLARKELVLDVIDKLINSDVNETEVNLKYIFLCKFLAKNIYVLKRRLRCTYDTIPWEEMEFFIAIFVQINTKSRRMFWCYRWLLTRAVFELHLKHFRDVIDVSTAMNQKLIEGQALMLPNVPRYLAIAKLRSKSKQAQQFYDDYERIRNIHSLDKIVQQQKMASIIRSNDVTASLVITRTLQIVGENLKNTWESPKLSTALRQRILRGGSHNDLLIKMRDLFVCQKSMIKRSELENKADMELIEKIQKDLVAFGRLCSVELTHFLIAITIEVIDAVEKCKSFSEIKLITGKMSIKNFEVNDTVEEYFEEWLRWSDVRALSERIKPMLIKKFTNFQVEKFDTVICELDSNFRTRIQAIVDCMKLIFTVTASSDLDRQPFSYIKIAINNFKFKSNDKYERNQLKIIEFLDIEETTKYSLDEEYIDLRNQLICALGLTSPNILSIEQLKHETQFDDYGATTQDFSQQIPNELLEQKVNSLERFLELESKRCCENRYANLPDKYRLSVEVLLLDILQTFKSVGQAPRQNSSLYLDEYYPMLLGRELRNHLAHDNALVDLLYDDPFSIIRSNARLIVEAFTDGRLMSDEKTVIGNHFFENMPKVQQQFEYALLQIENQNRLRVALKTGNTDDFYKLCKMDVELRSVDHENRTSLHYAVMGGCLAIVKYLLDRNFNIGDIDILGQNALHISAMQEHTNVFLHLLQSNRSGEFKSVCTYSNESLIDLAVRRGCVEIVKIIIEDNPRLKDDDDPLISAIENNRLDVVKILLQEKRINSDEHYTANTLLHFAALYGNTKVAEYLIEKGANVNAMNDYGMSPLYLAAREGNIHVARLLISRGANVNIRSTLQVSPIYIATQSNYEDLAILLIESGANADVATINGFGPLFKAASHSMLKLTKVLLENGLNPNVQEQSSGFRPIHSAALQGQLDIVKLLHENGADIDVRTRSSVTALYLACEKGFTDIVEYLLGHGCLASVQTIDNITPLQRASLNGHKDIVDLLLKFNAEVSTFELSKALERSIQGNHYETVSCLLKRGAQITALNSAASKEILELLLSHGLNVNSCCEKGNSILIHYVMKGDLKIVKYLVYKGADVNMKGLNVLSAAITSGHSQIVKFLLDKGATFTQKSFEIAIDKNAIGTVELLLKRFKLSDEFLIECLCESVLEEKREIVNIFLDKTNVDINGRSAQLCIPNIPLHIASHRGYRSIVEKILSKGANINERSDDDFTALLFAAERNQHEVLELLLHNGADPNVKGKNGWNAMFCAINNDFIQCVDVLLKHGNYNVNKIHVGLISGDGELAYDATLLHFASGKGNLEMVKYLVETAKADVNIVVPTLEKPIVLAVREGFLEIVKYFVELGMDINEKCSKKFTLLHHAAASKKSVNIFIYLLENGADLNAKLDIPRMEDVSVLQFSQISGNFNQLVGILSHMGYKIHLTGEEIDAFFAAVESNDIQTIDNFVNAKNYIDVFVRDEYSVLHAAVDGKNILTVRSLLKFNPILNRFNGSGLTPLHCAAKLNSLEIVKDLLANGAAYNIKSHNGETASDMTDDKKIQDIFVFIERGFKLVEKNNKKIIAALNKIPNESTVRAVMNARNTDGRTLLEYAVLTNYTHIDEWFERMKLVNEQHDAETKYALKTNDSEKQRKFYDNLYEKRKESLGDGCPATIYCQVKKAEIYVLQSNFKDASECFVDVLPRLPVLSNVSSQYFLRVYSFYQSIQVELGKHEEAVSDLEFISKKQSELCGSKDKEYAKTIRRLGKAYFKQRRFDDALTNYRKSSDIFSELNDKPGMFEVQEHVVELLTELEKYDEARKLLNETHQDKMHMYGKEHPHTLHTLMKMAHFEERLGKHYKAMSIYEFILKQQCDKIDPLMLHIRIINCRIQLNMVYSSLVYLHRYIISWLGKLERSDPYVKDIAQVMDLISHALEDHGETESLERVMERIECAVIAATDYQDYHTLKYLLNIGVDPNYSNENGQTAMHLAAFKNNVKGVLLLLEHGAHPMQATAKRNTALHTASTRGNIKIAEVLLDHVRRNDPMRNPFSSNNTHSDEVVMELPSIPGMLTRFVNFRTTGTQSTALHIAAQRGHFDVVMLLLRCGAAYDLPNGNGRTPIQLATNDDVRAILRRVDNAFVGVRNNDRQVVRDLKTLDESSNELRAILNARDKSFLNIDQITFLSKNSDQYIFQQISKISSKCRFNEAKLR